MSTDGMTLRLERVRAGVRVIDLAARMGRSRASIQVYERQAVVRSDIVAMYRNAVRELADVDERASA